MNEIKGIPAQEPEFSKITFGFEEQIKQLAENSCAISNKLRRFIFVNEVENTPSRGEPANIVESLSGSIGKLVLINAQLVACRNSLNELVGE
jgi:hypothetical protein